MLTEKELKGRETYFKNLLKRARAAHKKATEYEKLVFKNINDMFGTDNFELSDIPTKAENAENLEEAFLCYMQYGEYDIDSLWKELVDGANKNETDN